MTDRAAPVTAERVEPRPSVIGAADAADRALAAAAGEAADAVALAERSGLARFASSEVHQPTLIENVVVTLRVVRGRRVGLAVTNRIDDEGLRALADRARAAADSAVEDPAFPGVASAEQIPEASGFDPQTAGQTAEEQARAVAAAIEAVDGVDLYGFYTSGVTELAVRSTEGARADETLTDATVLVIAAGDGISGFAEQSAWSAARVDPAAVAREAADKAVRTRDAQDAEPRVYRAVLEPYAIADLLHYFSYDSLGALGLLEDRSYFTGRIGEQVASEQVTLVDDALDGHGLPKTFDFEGCAKRRVPLIENGVARDVVWDRVTAARASDERHSTGHSPPSQMREYGPLPFALSLAPGESSVEELVDLVGDGIYVTRLHYLNIVNPREGVITGMTRDGTFRIRDGKVAEPLVNLRFTVAVPQLLLETLGLSRETKLVNASDFYGERYPFGTLAPAIATAHFNITGIGSRPGI